MVMSTYHNALAEALENSSVAYAMVHGADYVGQPASLARLELLNHASLDAIGVLNLSAMGVLTLLRGQQ
jgi:hypothetical protein